MQHTKLKVGITPIHPCSYLNNHQEQLLVLMDHTLFCSQGYEHLLSLGFRRSGNDIYRPQCPACSACQSVRIDSTQFTFSHSQKRLWKKAGDIDLKPSFAHKPEYYALYEKYISLRHHDGVMHPPSQQQYDHFLLCQWLTPCFLELYDKSKLIGIAVTDIMPNSLSAVYTFYDPEITKISIGTLAILKQIEFAQKNDKKWLYLGYYVEKCQKMNYKNKFNPCQMFIEQQWKWV